MHGANWPTRRRAPRDLGRRVVAPLRRPGAGPTGRRGAAAEPGRSHRRHSHHGGARPARHRRQRAVSAVAAGHRAGPGRRQPGQQRPGHDVSGRPAWPSTWPGNWTSGASSSAASSRPMPLTSPASRSTTTCRCWSPPRRRASTDRSAPPSCGCASRTRTRRSRRAAWRSPSACSAAATTPSSTCSRPARST